MCDDIDEVKLDLRKFDWNQTFGTQYLILANKTKLAISMLQAYNIVEAVEQSTLVRNDRSIHSVLLRTRAR